MGYNEETSMGAKTAQISCGNLNPHDYLQIKLWQVWTRVAKLCNKT